MNAPCAIGCSRSIDVDFKPTTQPGVWLGVLRVVDEGHEVIVSDFYRLGPGRPGFDRMRDTMPLSRALPYAAPHVPYAYEVGWPDVVNPIKWAETAKDAVGTFGKPAIYAASIFTGGIPGLVAAYAADKTGVIDAIGSLAEKAGGVFMDFLGSVWFQALCSSIGVLVGVPELGVGCIIASLGMEMLNVIARRQLDKLPGLVKRAQSAALGLIKLEDLLNGLFSTIFSGMKNAGLSVDDIMRDAVGPIRNTIVSDTFVDKGAVDAWFNKNIVEKYNTGALQEYLTKKTTSATENMLNNAIRLPTSGAKSTIGIPSGPIPPGARVNTVDLRQVPSRSPQRAKTATTLASSSKLAKAAPYVLGAAGAGLVYLYLKG